MSRDSLSPAKESVMSKKKKESKYRARGCNVYNTDSLSTNKEAVMCKVRV